jgi:hypothetical protein
VSEKTPRATVPGHDFAGARWETAPVKAQEADMLTDDRETPDRKAGGIGKEPRKETAPGKEPPHQFDDWASI